MIANLAAAWRAYDALPLALKFLIYVLSAPLLELLFVFRVRRYLRLRTAQHVSHTAEDTATVALFWDYVLQHEDDIESIVRGWFLGDGPLLAGNLFDFVAWTLYARGATELSAGQRATATGVHSRLLRVIRAQNGTAIGDGYNPNLQAMTHTTAPLAGCWKPLLFYLITQTIRAVAGTVLRRRGFELLSMGELEYWYHPGSSAPASAAASAEAFPPSPSPPLPVVVLHGVGGFALYVPLALDIRRLRPEAPIVMPILRHCSLLAPPFDPPPPLDTTHVIASLAAALQRHAPASAPPRAAFLGHSLGTAFFASVAQQRPELIACTLLVDPICFLLYRHHVLYNFLYRTPTPLRKSLRQVLHAGYFFRLALHYILKLEPTIQSCFRREFWWGRHWLHPAELRAWPSKVVLSGRDAIVPAQLVHSCFLKLKLSGSGKAAGALQHERGERRPHAELELHERWHHGWSMLAPGSRGRLIGGLSGLMDEAMGCKRGAGVHGIARAHTAATYGSTSATSSEIDTEEDQSGHGRDVACTP